MVLEVVAVVKAATRKNHPHHRRHNHNYKHNSPEEYRRRHCSRTHLATAVLNNSSRSLLCLALTHQFHRPYEVQASRTCTITPPTEAVGVSLPYPRPNQRPSAHQTRHTLIIIIAEDKDIIIMCRQMAHTNSITTHRSL